ncbi:DNA-directed RNA polymerase subunit alpha [Pseudomonadota bacterium]
MTILKENWKELIKPSSISVKTIGEGKNAIVTVESLERGFGLTLGNALRRVLLSSIRGFAVTSVRIDGVLHEYSAIEGLREDVVDIIMNIKNLIIKKETASGCVLKLSSKEEGVVYANSIQTENGVEILNGDLAICTIEKGGSINLEMTVENGAGYSPSEQNKKAGTAVGTIFVDSIFSPVLRVSYEIKNARINQRTDYDKLVLNVETDGTTTPEEAIGLAAKILQDQLETFIKFDIPEDFEEEEKVRDELDPNLFKTIDELELSVRSYNCLKNENIRYVGDLVSKTESEMLKTSNFGRKSLNELKDNLKAMNLSFGMKLSNWPPKNVEEIASKLRKESFQ